MLKMIYKKMRHFLTFLICMLFSSTAISQTPDLKDLSKVYHSPSLIDAYAILKKSKGFEGNVILKMWKGDSVIMAYFGSDSLRAREQSGRILVVSEAFRSEEMFTRLKLQADKIFTFVKSSKAESLGVRREHFVYGQTKSLAKGELQIALTHCFDLERKETFYSFYFAPNPGY